MEIKCANLDLMRRQVAQKGFLEVNADVSSAKLAIAQSLGPVQFVGSVKFPEQLNIPTTDLLSDQELIKQAREEAIKSTCWIGKVGCVVFTPKGGELVKISGHNHSVTPGKCCHDLEIDISEVQKLLIPGERLDFCQAIHDVADVVAKAASLGVSIKGGIWGLSLEPCDNCANLLVATEAKQVYFSLGVGRQRYYNSAGLQRLLTNNIPVFQVRMTEDE